MFSTPGFIDDFRLRPDKREAFARGWDAIIDDYLTSFAGREGGSFYNPSQDETPGEPARQSVAWDAFPQPIRRWFENVSDSDRRRWSSAETLRPLTIGGQPLRRVRGDALAEPVQVFFRQQDEYCEWFAHRDDTGRITRVTFTCESPEYWRFLAMGTRRFFPAEDDRSTIFEGDLDLVAELYRAHVDPSVTVDDLVWPFDVAAFDSESGRWLIRARAGWYNEHNKWNTTHGAMHLTHPANTLVGEFIVASRAAVLRRARNGNPVNEPGAVVCCSGFGDPNRSSDPSIGGAVNGLARQGLSVSLADPVGLYVAGINIDAFSGPQGEEVDAWTVDRGDSGREMTMRATFAAPDGVDFRVEDMRVGGQAISFGGQIADEVTMILTGLAKRRGRESTDRQACTTKCCEHPDKPDVSAVIGNAVNCATVDWVEQAPVPPEEAITERRSPELLAEGPDAGVAVQSVDDSIVIHEELSPKAALSATHR